MDFLTSGFNVFLIIVGFGVLIFIHELGHFIAAKWANIRTEAFAVGMGPVMMAWRKGIGLRFGSTAAEYERRVRFALGQSTPAKDTAKANKNGEDEAESANLPHAEMYRIGDQLGLGETEYSLRWLPIGGFVKMLGQEDANPNYVSNDPRSYTRCPVGKRMIVVSAGVIMNLILAVILFIIAFMIGVKFEAPVVGDVSPMLPAGRTIADNAAALNIATAGLQPGDLVTEIDGEAAKTFADLQIASAMSKPGVPVQLKVKRAGYVEPLQFTLMPEKDATTGLLSIGVAPGSSTTLFATKDETLHKILSDAGLTESGVKPGMQLARVNGMDVQTYEQVNRQINESDGKPISTEWVWPEGKPSAEVVRAELVVEPEFEVLRYVKAPSEKVQNFEFGLLGMTPLPAIKEVPGGLNRGVLQADDVILRVAGVEGPRVAQFMHEVNRHPNSEIDLLVLRGGEPTPVKARVDKNGKLNVYIRPAYEVPLTAEPLDEVKSPNPSGGEMMVRKTPVAPHELFARTRIDAIGGAAVSNWPDIRQELRRQTEAAFRDGKGALVQITTTLPTRGNPQETSEIELAADEVKSLHALDWQTQLPGFVFEPIYTTRTANGSPVKAVSMGFEETKKLVVMTYLTIDRLFRRSVGVDQLRGPVGIVHIGSKVADRGFTYLIFFLAMISVNLAVINFLPMPIVDGGLFLFLIYEKFKGRPPSLAFQNAATMVGLFIIGTLFVVTFYNDVLRLIG